MSDQKTPTQQTEKKQAATAYQVITDQFVKALEQGTVPWQRPFKLPQNMDRKKEYTGLNRMLLSMTSFTSPYYLTYKQVLDKEGKIKEGEERKGNFVTWWKRFEVMSDGSLKPVDPEKEKKQEVSHVDDDKANTQTDEEVEQAADVVEENEPVGTGKIIPYLRYYKVFNIPDQTEGIEVPKAAVSAKTPTDLEREGLEKALAFLDQSDICPVLVRGTQPCYDPLKKEVWMPPETNFTNTQEWLMATFHELCHAADHKMGRDMKGQMEGYAMGELVAEIGAAYIGSDCGVMDKVAFDNAAGYVKGWADRLKSDPKLVVLAAARAQKVVRLLKHEITLEQIQEQKAKQDAPKVTEKEEPEIVKPSL